MAAKAPTFRVRIPSHRRTKRTKFAKLFFFAHLVLTFFNQVSIFCTGNKTKIKQNSEGNPDSPAMEQDVILARPKKGMKKAA